MGMMSVSRPVLAVLDVLPETSRAALAESFPGHELVHVTESTEDERRRVIADAEAALVMWSAVEASVFEAGRHCRVVQKLGVGVDKIDLDAASRCGIPVLRAAGINSDAVAEMTMLLILAVARDLGRAVDETRQGGFPKEEVRARAFQLTGKTAGLVGFGHIGRAVARRLAAFGVTVLYHDVMRASVDDERACAVTYAELGDLTARSDIVSLHLPATADNRGLVGSAFLAGMKQGAMLVNTARGTLVDDDALAAAIASGHLLGAGLDVTSVEPLPRTSPLWDLERVVVTPHIGGAVANNFPRVAARAAHNVAAVLGGRRSDVALGDVACWPSPSM